MSEDGRSRTSMGELLGAFAYASDLAFGLHLEDSLRSCFVTMRIAEHLGLSEDERLNVYYTALLKDAGCNLMDQRTGESVADQRDCSAAATHRLLRLDFVR